MVNEALLEQVNQLSTAELAELRGVIEARLADQIPAGQWAILDQRIHEADENPGDFITLDEFKTKLQQRRSA